ncbi:MAG: hypothetical protein M1365_11740 [Actinobacteria bacterium]|nr:hypothetical protein [Actinomycetota bacterium]
MVATVLAGMELLGNLLMPNSDPFDPNRSNYYFLNYWDNYFSMQYPPYSGLGRLFRQLMRNGISHTFVAKPGIFVEKGTNRQMSIDTTKQEIYIDCVVLFKEFEDSYKKLVRPIIDGAVSSSTTSKATMQTRLDDLSKAYSDDSTRLFVSLPPLNPSTVNTMRRSEAPVSPLFSHIGTKMSGASLPMQPTSTSTLISTSTSSPRDASATAPMPSTTLPFTTTSGGLSPKIKP